MLMCNNTRRSFSAAWCLISNLINIIEKQLSAYNLLFFVYKKVGRNLKQFKIDARKI